MIIQRLFNSKIFIILYVLILLSSSIVYADYNINLNNNKFIIYNNASISLYLANNNNIIFIPIEKVLINSFYNYSYINTSNMKNIQFSFIISDKINFSDNNNIISKDLNIYFYILTGIPVERAILYNISVNHFTNNSIDVELFVLVPPPDFRDQLGLIGVLYANKVVFEYEFYNDTHFILNIKMYDVKFNDITFSTSMKFDIYIRFLVNKLTWEVKYWNGDRWIDAGVIPIGAPDLDVSSLLFNLYVHYYNLINIFLNNNRLLDDILSKLRSYLAFNDTKGLNEYILNLSVTSIPPTWRTQHLIYINESYVLNPATGTAKGRASNFTVPDYVWVRATLSPSFFEMKNEIVDAVIHYLNTNDSSLLDDIIYENNGFIHYKPLYHTGGYTQSWLTYKGSVVPGASPLHMLIPVDGVMGLPEDLANLSTMIVLNVIPTNNFSIINDELYESPNMNSSGIVIVSIDERLASEWFMSRYSIDPTLRSNILLNILNNIMYEYRLVWYKILNGEDPQRVFDEFESKLRESVIAAALQIGGEAGKARLEEMLSGIGTNHNIIDENFSYNSFVTSSEILTTGLGEIDKSRERAGDGFMITILGLTIIVILFIILYFIRFDYRS